MRHHLAFALALLSTVLLASCGGGASPSSSSRAPGGSAGASGLEGRTFFSTAIDGRVLVTGSRIRLSFINGEVGAIAGCNSMGGPYRLDAGRILAPQLATTDMGCAQALMTQDQWVADLLNGAAFALDGNSLTLARNGVRVTFLDREVADPDRPLLGTRWVVVSVISGDAASSLPIGAVAALTFSAGRVDVETGCNSGSGTATTTDRSITFAAIGLTKRGCPPEVMRLEQAVSAVLSGAATYAIEADSLTLMAGRRGLTLRAAA